MSKPKKQKHVKATADMILSVPAWIMVFGHLSITNFMPFWKALLADGTCATPGKTFCISAVYRMADEANADADLADEVIDFLQEHGFIVPAHTPIKQEITRWIVRKSFGAFDMDSPQTITGDELLRALAVDNLTIPSGWVVHKSARKIAT